MRVNDDAPAIEYFQKALKIAPQDAKSQYQLGVLLDRNDRGAGTKAKTEFAGVRRLKQAELQRGSIGKKGEEPALPLEGK